MQHKFSTLVLACLFLIPSGVAFSSDFFTWGVAGGAILSTNSNFGQANDSNLQVNTGQNFGWAFGVHGRAADYFATWAVSGDLEFLHPLDSSNANVGVKQNGQRGSVRIEFGKDSLFNSTYYLAGPFLQRMDSRFTPVQGPVVTEVKVSPGVLVGIGHRWTYEGGKCSYMECIARDTSAPPGVTLELYFGYMW